MSSSGAMGMGAVDVCLPLHISAHSFDEEEDIGFPYISKANHKFGVVAFDFVGLGSNSEAVPANPSPSEGIFLWPSHTINITFIFHQPIPPFGHRISEDHRKTILVS
ncbi:hypothetical protein VTI28DRAFT_2865 [Corynascus sepedonium]